MPAMQKGQPYRNVVTEPLRFRRPEQSKPQARAQGSVKAARQIGRATNWVRSDSWMQRDQSDVLCVAFGVQE
jgi:hypothetical protein